MATGAEHYRAAEKCIERAEECNPSYAAVAFAEAQVHATLALAAATAIQTTDQYVSDEGSDETETIHEVNQWHEAAVRGKS